MPLDAAIVRGGDDGEPIVVAQQDGPHAETFANLARAVAEQAEKNEQPSLSIF